VSLRTDIHSAFDAVTPSTFGMPERVVDTVETELQLRRRHRRWYIRLRAPLSLVAVLLLLAMAIGVLVGGRVLQDWNTFLKSAPAGPQSSELAQLEARPMQMPYLKAGDPCPTSSPRAIFYGSGPAYGGAPLASYYSYKTSWGDYWDMELVVDAGVKGLVLVRARDLRTNQPVIFVGPYSGGPAIGADTVDGKVVRQHLELVLDTSHPQLNEAGLQLVWSFIVGLANGYSACTGWQIDGHAFTETYVGSGD